MSSSQQAPEVGASPKLKTMVGVFERLLSVLLKDCAVLEAL
jgi:hypothetical protein